MRYARAGRGNRVSILERFERFRKDLPAVHDNRLTQSTSMPPFRRAALFAIFSNSARLVTSAMAALASPPSSFAAAFDSGAARRS